MATSLNTDAFAVTYKSKKTNTYKNTNKNTNDSLGVRDGIEANGAPIATIANIAMGLLIMALIVLIAVFFKRPSHAM